MRARIWEEHQKVRSISTGEGPFPVYEGETVVVIAVRTRYEAGAIIAALRKREGAVDE